ncbi:AAA family ATPase [Candidatus Ventrimonas sp. KK005]
MKLLDLHIDGFGKFHDRDLVFSDGLNIIHGKNEAGKSTIHTFIRCMLFGLERARGRASKNDTWSHYEPWDNKAAYGGWLRLEQDKTIYRIERNFRKDKKSLTIVDETLGKQVEPTKVFLDQLLCGLSETSYINTISIGQLKSATDGGMVAELRNYIANMNTTGNMSLNITRATSHLRSKRKDFDRMLDPDAARNYTALLADIRNMEREIAAPEYENQLQSYQNMRSQVQDQISRQQQERETLLQKIASGRQSLAGAQFNDEDSVTAYRDETAKIYESYQSAKTACEKKSPAILAGLAFFLTLLTAVFATVLGVQEHMRRQALTGLSTKTTPMFSLHDPALLLMVGLIVLSLLFVIIGIAIVSSRKRHRRDLSYASKLLQEVFSRHLGDSSISGEAMDAFLARMEEYIRLSQTLVRSEATLEEYSSEIASLKDQAASCDDIISRQQKTQWELEKKLDYLAQCKDQVEALKQVLEENDRIREEIAAIDLALDTMTELSSTIRDSFGLYLNKAASDMIFNITGGAYDSMSVDENLNLFMNTRTKLVPVTLVSSGTLDQVYLALRLAAAQLIQSGHDQMPLIFDDSFVQYDEERLKTTLKWLSQTYEHQILLFTCHQREAQMMTASQLAFHLIKI